MLGYDIREDYNRDELNDRDKAAFDIAFKLQTIINYYDLGTISIADILGYDFYDIEDVLDLMSPYQDLDDIIEYIYSHTGCLYYMTRFQLD